jgi:hypothetical protein
MPAAIPFGWTVQNVSGTAVSGAKIYFYIEGTTTPRTPYSDIALTVPTANPVVADAAGYFRVYLSSDLSYDIVVKSADDSITYQERRSPAASAILGRSDVETHAAARLLTPVAGTSVQILGRTTAGDFGGGLYRARTGSDADNDGTVLVCANGIRLEFMGEYCTPEQWGATTGTSGSCAAAVSAWVAQITLGRAPKWLHHPQQAVYRYLSAVSPMVDLGLVKITFQGIGTNVYKAFTSTSESDGVFVFRGSVQPVVGSFAARCSDNHEGGSIVRIESTSTNAAAYGFIDAVYGTFENSPVQTITSATAANPAVFTLNAHGYSNGNVVVFRATGGDLNWAQNNLAQYTVSDATTNTFTLTSISGGSKINSTGYSAFGAATIGRRRAPHAYISIDGSQKTTGAIGARGFVIRGCQLFGAGLGGLHLRSVIGAYLSNNAFSGAGLNAGINITGTPSVSSQYVTIAGGLVDGIIEDYSIGFTGEGINQGDHIRTVNTQDSTWRGPIAGLNMTVGTRNSGASYMPISGGQVLQRKTVSGMTSAYTTVTFPMQFKTTPRVWVEPLNCPNTLANAIQNSPTVTGVDVAGGNLSAGGDVEVYAVGEGF